MLVGFPGSSEHGDMGNGFRDRMVGDIGDRDREKERVSIAVAK